VVSIVNITYYFTSPDFVKAFAIIGKPI